MKRTSAGAPLSFGTTYYPDHWPERDWSADLDAIADAGLKTVRFGEFSWSWYEPEPGKFDFSGFDRFVGLAERKGLGLCLCTPTATPPPWMDRLFPDGRLMDMHGKPCLSHRHFWCWNHPASRAKAEETLSELVRRYAGRRCLWGWQIDNEPNYAEQQRLHEPESMYDWNPHSRRTFAGWLERRHGTIDALNDAWWTRFWSQRVRTWEEAASPRGRVNPGAWLDFMRWRESALAEQIRWQAGILRGLSPGTRIGCNIPETGAAVSVNLGQDYWAQAAGLDWVGADLYQATGKRGADLARHAFGTDLLRSAAEAAGAEFFVSETQAGPHVRSWPNRFAGEGFEPDYLEDCAKVYSTRGATRIWWFLWRPTLGGAEAGMNGVQAIDGSATPRTTRVRRLARTAEKLGARRTAWLRRPLALVHYSRDSLLLFSAFSSDLLPLNHCLEGWHAFLEALGFRVDFCGDRELETAALPRASLTVAPCTIAASDAAIRGLAGAAAPIWVGPHTGQCDSHGRLRTRGSLAPLVDRMGASPGLWRDVGPMPRLPALGPVPGWRELLPTAARTVLRFAGGAPALTSRGRDCWWSFDVGACFDLGGPSARRFLRHHGQRLVRQPAPRPLRK